MPQVKDKIRDAVTQSWLQFSVISNVCNAFCVVSPGHSWKLESDVEMVPCSHAEEIHESRHKGLHRRALSSMQSDYFDLWSM